MKVLAVGRKRVHTKQEYDAAVAELKHDRGLPLLLRTPDGRTGQVTIGGRP